LGFFLGGALEFGGGDGGVRAGFFYGEFGDDLRLAFIEEEEVLHFKVAGGFAGFGAADDDGDGDEVDFGLEGEGGVLRSHFGRGRLLGAGQRDDGAEQEREFHPGSLDCIDIPERNGAVPRNVLHRISWPRLRLIHSPLQT